jgi:hypothetical protein
VGHRCGRRRGNPLSANGGDRGGSSHLLPLRQAARAAGRSHLDRQRPPGQLPRFADPADDQHLHPAGRRRPPRR